MSGAKTEQPSAKRLRDARRQGNLARSRTLASAVAIAGALLVTLRAIPGIAARLHDFTRLALLEAGRGDIAPALALERAWLTLGAASLPLLTAALLFALVGAGGQVGALVNPGAIGFKPERLGPAQGFKRVFSTRNLVEVLKSLLVATVTLWLVWGALRDGARNLAALPALEASAAFGAARALLEALCLKALVAALFLGGADYLLERRAHRRGLMMSREELVREHKESEGDPRHKARRKQAHKALLNGTLARGVQRATALVVNPTHVAVGLRYDPAEASAPTIVAKGVEEEAARIRALARRLRIPIVEDVPLARALVRCELGEEVPEELYQAAAVVLRQVYEAAAAPGSTAADQADRRSA